MVIVRKNDAKGCFVQKAKVVPKSLKVKVRVVCIQLIPLHSYSGMALRILSDRLAGYMTVLILLILLLDL